MPQSFRRPQQAVYRALGNPKYVQESVAQQGVYSFLCEPCQNREDDVFVALKSRTYKTVCKLRQKLATRHYFTKHFKVVFWMSAARAQQQSCLLTFEQYNLVINARHKHFFVDKRSV